MNNLYGGVTPKNFSNLKSSSQEKKNIKIFKKSFTLADSLKFRDIENNLESKTIQLLTTRENPTKDKSDHQTEYNHFEDFTEEIPVPKHLNDKKYILHPTETKKGKESIKQYLSKLKGISSKGNSKDFRKAFKDIIDIYINKGYRIPDLSIRNNLFKLSPLLVPDNKLEECYEICKTIDINNISNDKNVIYLSKLLNLSLENELKISGKNFQKTKEDDKNFTGRIYNQLRHHGYHDQDEKKQRREIKKIEKNINMLNNLIKEKEAKDHKKREKVEIKAKIKMMRDKAILKEIASEFNLKINTSKTELPQIKKPENFLSNSTESKKHLAIDTNFKQDDIVLPQLNLSPVINKKTKKLSQMDILPKTYKTELIMNTLPASSPGGGDKKKFLKYVFNNVYTHNVDHIELKNIVANYCKNFLNYDNNQIQEIMNK